MNAIKKIIAVLLCMVMLLCIMPVVSFSAADTSMVLDTYYDEYITDEDYVLYTFTPKASDYYRFFTVGFTDTYVNVYEEDYYDMGFDDDSGVEYNCNYTLYLEKGVTYYFYVGIYDWDGEFEACITRMGTAPYTGIAKNKVYNVTLNENKNSQLFKYVPTKSGTYAFSSSGSYDAYCIFYDSQWTPIYSNDDGAGDCDFYLDCYLEAGETYYFEATQYYAWGDENYTVSIKETPIVEDIEIVSYPDDLSCYYDYIYETLDLRGLKVKLTYTDGSIKYWEYDDDYIIGSNMECSWGYDENEEPYVEVYTTFCYDFFYLQPEYNPVEYMTVKENPEVKYYEYCDGYWDEFGDFYYYEPSLDGFEFEVHYYDGTTETVNYYDGINGKPIYYDSSQYDEPWSIGGDNFIVFEYFGVEAYYEVEIEENPVDSVTLNRAPTAVYTYGDEYYGWWFEDHYEFYPFNLEGISMTINYKDGTTQELTADDFDIYEEVANGLPFTFDWISVEGPGTYVATMYIMGQEFSYNVVVSDEYAPTTELGDVDLDGTVSIMDATEIQLYKASMIELSDEAILVADVDNDSEVSIMDATMIQMFIADLVPGF